MNARRRVLTGAGKIGIIRASIARALLPWRRRRGARAVEWAGLENRNRGNSIVGSNPTLSAKRLCNALKII